MKIAVISDIHANLAALEAFFENEEYDELFLVGDIIGYGPNPVECVGRIMGKFETDVQGNHDRAYAEGGSVRSCPPAYQKMADEVMAWTRGKILGEPELFLKEMPRMSFREADFHTFATMHGSPSDLVFGMIDPNADEDELMAELNKVEADTIIVANGHVPYVRQFGEKTLVCPGSIGLPRDGIPEISYAVIESGDPAIVRRPYDIERTVADLNGMDVSEDTKSKLAHILRTATDPE